MIDIKNIDVSYGKLQALWNVSIKVKEKSITVLIGLNGSGKTTLLKTISGILKPSNGSIYFMGQRIDNLQPYEIPKLGIAHIPEGRHLFPYMTVIENLEIGAYLPKARREKDNTLEDVFKLFPLLKERQNQMASTLSGGEQQMLTIARGLMLRPKVMLLDEISQGLAPKLVRATFDMIIQLNNMNITLFLVEQNVRQALKIADYGYVIEGGKIIFEGKANEIAEIKEIRKIYMGI